MANIYGNNIRVKVIQGEQTYHVKESGMCNYERKLVAKQ